jgi:hypothetical protein
MSSAAAASFGGSAAAAAASAWNAARPSTIDDDGWETFNMQDENAADAIAQDWQVAWAWQQREDHEAAERMAAAGIVDSLDSHHWSESGDETEAGASSAATAAARHAMRAAAGGSRHRAAAASVIRAGARRAAASSSSASASSSVDVTAAERMNMQGKQEFEQKQLAQMLEHERKIRQEQRQLAEQRELALIQQIERTALKALEKVSKDRTQSQLASNDPPSAL